MHGLLAGPVKFNPCILLIGIFPGIQVGRICGDTLRNLPGNQFRAGNAIGLGVESVTGEIFGNSF